MQIVYIVIAVIITLPIVTASYYSKKNSLGAILCIGLAVPAWLLGKKVPVAGGAVFGILLGMLCTSLWDYPDSFRPGIKDTSKRVLQAAIVLFGFQMNLGHVMSMSGQAFILIAATIVTAFLVAFFVGRLIGIDGNEQTLIGIGTAICGGSAIAAAAPVISASDEEVAKAISTIFLFNVLAVFVFPLAGHLAHMSDLRFGMWAGAAINDTSSVVAASYSYSDAAGNTATVVKLTRTLMIIPVTFILALRQSNREQTKGTGFNVLKTFPWFVAAFLAACILNTSGIIPQGMAGFWA
ncbi:MAG: putative sulfate exporter family transporter, partial [Bacillota bacterium]